MLNTVDIVELTIAGWKLFIYRLSGILIHGEQSCGVTDTWDELCVKHLCPPSPNISSTSNWQRNKKMHTKNYCLPQNAEPS